MDNGSVGDTQSKSKTQQVNAAGLRELQRRNQAGRKPAGGLHLHTGEEQFGCPVAVVAQLCGVDGAGPLGVDDGCALEVLRPMAGLEFKPSSVVAPGAVG